MIGELVMEMLATLDQVAYNRSASAYRNFREQGFRRICRPNDGGDD